MCALSCLFSPHSLTTGEVSFFESARDPQRVKLSAEESCLSAEGWNWDFGGVFLEFLRRGRFVLSKRVFLVFQRGVFGVSQEG